MNYFLLAFINLFVVHLVDAQLEVDRGINKKELIRFFGGGTAVDIVKVRYRGAQRAAGTFVDNDSIFNMHSGLILSTGAIKKLPGTNTSPFTSSRNFRRGYKKLNGISKRRTKDAAILWVSFIPKQEYFSFNYVFGSEEYPEYINSGFSDAFALYLRPSGGKSVNLALIPDSNSRIAVDQVNHVKNQCYYVNNTKLSGKIITHMVDTTELWVNQDYYHIYTLYNIEAAIADDPKIPVEFDGYTKLLQAKATVVPGKKYTLIICIADAGDRIYDSGVLIESGSLNASSDKNFKFGALATDSNYYFERDTVLIKKYVKSVKADEPLKLKIDTTFTYFYDSDVFNLNNRSAAQIEEFIMDLNTERKFEVSILAFTDEDGSVTYNKELSSKRARGVGKVIADLLLENITIIESNGRGIDNAPSNKSQKRRTEIRITSIE